MKYQNKIGNRILNKIRPLGPDAAHGRTALLGWPCGGLSSRPTPKQSSGPTRPSPYDCFSPPGENRGGKSPPPPDAGGSPAKFVRPAVVGRRGNGLRVAPGDGGSDLRQKAVRGSPRVALHDGMLRRGRVIGGRPEKGSRLALKWTLRSLGLGRCSRWSRCGRGMAAMASLSGGVRTRW
jgi:hypothetical protein